MIDLRYGWWYNRSENKNDRIEKTVMKHSILEKWLKLVIIGMGFCGVFVYGWGFPHICKKLCGLHPELTATFYAWLIFLIITVIPCYGLLIFAWRIADNIGKGEAFSYGNGKAFRGIFWMAASDTVFFLLGNLIFLILKMNRPEILLVSAVLIFFGIAIAVCARAMSYLVDNAADLQEENNGTI